jgi:hypothetical protein
MSEKEARQIDLSDFYADVVIQGKANHFSPDQFTFLLSRGFDLFNLIQHGLAIDKTKMK